MLNALERAGSSGHILALSGCSIFPAVQRWKAIDVDPDLREILGFGPENITEIPAAADEEWLLAETVAKTDAIRSKLATFAALRIDGQAMLRSAADVMTLAIDNRVVSEHNSARIPSFAWDCDHHIDWDVSGGVFTRSFANPSSGEPGIASVGVEGLRFAAEDLAALAHVVPEFKAFSIDPVVTAVRKSAAASNRGTKSKDWWPIMAAIIRQVEAGKLGTGREPKYPSEAALWQGLLKDPEFEKHVRIEAPDRKQLSDRTVKEQIYKLYRSLYKGGA